MNPSTLIINNDNIVQLTNSLSVLKGEVPFLTFEVEGVTVGKLWGTGGTLSFEGDCAKSAQLFFDHVIELNRLHLNK